MVVENTLLKTGRVDGAQESRVRHSKHVEGNTAVDLASSWKLIDNERFAIA
jgi:hypothetical protein